MLARTIKKPFLPTGAQQKLNRIHSEMIERESVWRVGLESLKKLQKQEGEARDTLEKLNRSYNYVRSQSKDPDAGKAERQAVKTQETIVSDLAEAVADAKEQNESARGAMENAKTVYQKINSWTADTRNHNGKQWEMADTVKPADDIDSVRAEIAGLKKSLATVRRAPLDHESIEIEMRRYVEDLAKKARPVLTDPAQGFGLQAPDQAQHSPYTTALAIQAWLNPEAVVTALQKQIAELPEGMEPEAKQFKIAELSEQLEKLERSEEAAITLAAANGQFIPRRIDADPVAVLGIQSVKRVQAA